MPIYFVVLLPVQHSVTGQFDPIVADYKTGIPAKLAPRRAWSICEMPLRQQRLLIEALNRSLADSRDNGSKSNMNPGAEAPSQRPQLRNP